MSALRSVRRLALLALVVSALLVAACGVDDDPTAEGGTGEGEGAESTGPPLNPQVSRPAELDDLRGQASVTVEITDNQYEPRNFIVDPGTEIVFENIGANPHNVVPAAEGAFDRITENILTPTGSSDGGGSGTLVLDEEGDYPFYCSIHGAAIGGQTGYVIVGEGSPELAES